MPATRQLTLDEIPAGAGRRCRAISIRTSERCEHDALPGVPYCHDHYHLLGDSDGTSCSESS